MRPHSRYSVDAGYPRARAVCDRCGFQYQHDQLSWQYQWVGPKLQNLRLLVCCDCLDKPQPQLRTFIIPADPLPIYNPRPENYTQDDNPISPLGTSFGTLINFAGLDAAFNMGTNKPYIASAGITSAIPGYGNTVGRFWGPNDTNKLAGFSLYAPNDVPIHSAGTAYKIQGSIDGVSFTDIYLGAIAGTIGEVITVQVNNGTPYNYHQINFSGTSGVILALAQFVINTSGQALGEAETVVVTTPANSYTAEDGVTLYVAEDGTTVYIQES